MTEKIFIDSNVWCYLFIKDEHEKYRTAGSSIFVISYQVINEVTNKLIQMALDHLHRK